MTQKERYEFYKPLYEEFIKLYPFTLEDLPGEQWRPIDGYEDYQVSNFGRVKSFKRKEPRIKTPKLEGKGYLSQSLGRQIQ